MSYYRTGTISIVQRTVTAIGAQFLAYVKVGDTLIVNGVSGVVENVASNNSLLLTDIWAGPGVANSSDWIIVNTGLGWSSTRVLNATLATILSRLDEGTPFRPDDWITNVSQRANFVNRNPGFILARTDTTYIQVSVKLSAGDVWTDWKEMRGPPGAPGSAGTVGPAGENSTVPGPEGPESWATPVDWTPGLACVAEAPRTTVTFGGDFYVCTVEHTAAGTFNAGNWIKVANRGDAGDAGPRGNSVLSLAGTSAPTGGLGQDGDYAYNPQTKILYGPKADGAWPTGISLEQIPDVTTVDATGPTLSLSYGSARHIIVNLQASVTSLTISDWPSVGLARLTIEVRQTGAFTLSWPAPWLWSNGLAPGITSGNGARDLYAVTTTDGGTTLTGHVVGQDFKTA
jgi:hypothetical protein